MITGCRDSTARHSGDVWAYSSYRDIPSVSGADIEAIEALKERYGHFTYGMIPSTEAFLRVDGEIGGFSALLCAWLGELFDVPFVLERLNWHDLLDGLERGTVHFTGDLTASEARRGTYAMTEPIAQRSLKYFQFKDGVPLSEIAKSRLPRYLLPERTTIAADVSFYSDGTFEPVYFLEYEEAYEILKSGGADALVTESVQEAFFDVYGDVATSDYFPLLYSPVSLSTQDEQLRPIISVVQLALENGAEHFLFGLYEDGYGEYLRHKLFTQLTDEEREYIRQNPVILFGAEHDNYPVSFYDERYGQWQGIVFDVLREVGALSGLGYKVVNGSTAPFSELLGMLERGEIDMLSEVIRSPEREGLFIWPENSFMTERSVLISAQDHRNVSMSMVYGKRIGLNKGTAHTEFFHTWFPNHPDNVEYNGQAEMIDALINGEVDLVMDSYNALLGLTHYRELPYYKAGVVFDNKYDCTFGLGTERELLCSIIDKCLAMIDTGTISEQWMNKTYDYRSKLTEERQPLLLGIAALAVCVIALFIALFIRSRQAGRAAERLVGERTLELAVSNSEQRKAREAAELANHAKTVFLANMSHEIRTPMNAIMGVTEILLQNEKLSPEVEDGLDKIFGSCNLLLGIINDILDFSKIDAGKLDIVDNQYSVASLLSDSAHLNMMRIDSKPIEFVLEVDENTPSRLIGDELRIKQILNNLLSNAFKYTDRGVVTLSAACETELGVRNATLLLEVRDTGCGMSKEQLDALFEEYTRFTLKNGRTVEGTGLGLAITQRLLDMMNGEIYAESEPGKGSRFTVKLPQTTVDSAVLGADVVSSLKKFQMKFMSRRERRSVVRDPMPYGSVLIVDDVETNLYVAIGLLKLYKLKIDTASSGVEAVDKIKRGNVYDIIFMDHMMPEMDGMEATRRIREFGYRNPVVALTANAVAGQSAEFLRNGFDEFISKPIDIRQLNTVLNRLVRDKQPPEVVEAIRLAQNSVKPTTGKAPDKAPEKAPDKAPDQAERMLIAPFVRDSRKTIGLLEALEQKAGWHDNDIDLRMFRVSVHGCKSSLLQIGKTELARTAEELEDASRDRDFSVITRLAPGFLNELRALVAQLDAAEGEAAADVDARQDDEDVDELLGRLRVITDACSDYNRKSALDAITLIINPSSKTKSILERIKEHVLHSDYEEAESLAAAYMGELAPEGLDIAAPAKAALRLRERELDGLDILDGLERYEGDEESYFRVLRSYAASIRSMLGTIETISGDTLDAYRITVHGVKGASFDIFTMQIGALAQELEKAARDGDLDFILRQNPAFLDITNRFLDGLDRLILTIDEENPKPVKDKPDPLLLARLLEACRQYDMDEVNAVMETIELYKYEGDDGLSAWLRENVNIMRFSQIVERLSDI